MHKNVDVSFCLNVLLDWSNLSARSWLIYRILMLQLNYCNLPDSPRKKTLASIGSMSWNQKKLLDVEACKVVALKTCWINVTLTSLPMSLLKKIWYPFEKQSWPLIKNKVQNISPNFTDWMIQSTLHEIPVSLAIMVEYGMNLNIVSGNWFLVFLIPFLRGSGRY